MGTKHWRHLLNVLARHQVAFILVTVLMEELVGYLMLRSELLAGNISAVAVQKVAVHMANMHRATHKDNISAEEWNKLEQEIESELNDYSCSTLTPPLQLYKTYMYTSSTLLFCVWIF